MDVDEAGRRQAARAVDATRSVDGRCGTVTNDVDAPVPDYEVPAGVLLVELIDRRDRAAVNDQRFRGHADTAGDRPSRGRRGRSPRHRGQQDAEGS
jgi:hypothetical protein